MRNLEDILINSKKVMNKVDTGDYQRGNVNPDVIGKSAEELTEMYGGNVPVVPQQAAAPTQAVQNYVQAGTDQYAKAVNESRLPAHIKALMLENPIATPDVPLENSLDINFTNRVAEKMKKMDMIDNPKLMKGNIKEAPQPRQEYSRQPQPQAQQAPQNTGGVLGISEAALKELKPLIEHIVESSIEKILEQKLKEQDNKVKKMDESLQIRVGKYIFTGKITGSKSV